MKSKTMILCLALALFISGCVPVVIAAVGATAGGAIIYDKRSTEVILQDIDITNKAAARLNQDPELQGQARVDIAVFNHVVLMVGQAQTEAFKQRAEDDIRDVPNVRRIYNQVEISPLSSLWDRSEDTWITSKVKTQMLATRGLSSSQIKVVTENKTVYLMGIVTPKQAELATEATRKVSGVRKVVKVFEYEE